MRVLDRLTAVVALVFVLAQAGDNRVHPPEHGDVIDLDPAFDQQFLDVPMREV